MKAGKNLKLTRCVDCNEIIPLSVYDSYPEYVYDIERDILREQKRDDRKNFEDKHQRHHLEELQVIEGSCISGGPYREPVKASYFEVTNGSENFVIKKWRKDIYDPLTYELIPGHLAFTELMFSPQYDDIRKQFQTEVKLTDHTEEKMEHFLTVVRSVISQMNESDLETEDLYETDNPAIVYVQLNEEKVGKILEGCRTVFTPEELKKLAVFIRENNEHDGVMTALVKRQFEIKRTGSNQEIG